MECSVDGSYLACGGQNKCVWVWKIDSNKTTQGNKGNARFIFYKTDTKRLVNSNSAQRFFERTPYRIYRGHSADILDISWSKVTRQIEIFPLSTD
jgi:WD40 repeat protein